MPELPEVEVTRMGIEAYTTGYRVLAMRVHQPKLRWPVEAQWAEDLRDAQITHTLRRGKYLGLACTLTSGDTGVLLIHLGMSGSLRVELQPELNPRRTHDHIEWVFEGWTLRYHDPRRFGAVLWHDNQQGDWLQHPRLGHLGREPFDADCDAAFWYQRTRSMRQTIKTVLLGGSIVVGVGNIYASEVLFLSAISPYKRACDLSYDECARLAQQIPILLQKAIRQGGSTLKDFVGSDGHSGYFQMHFAVYDRAGQPCLNCQQPIARVVQAQRATYFCPHCQPC